MARTGSLGFGSSEPSSPSYPGTASGPYADVRKWVNEQLAETRQRGRVVHRDSIAVRRQGAAQIAVVGAPNAGKSSLLQALSSVQIKTGDYAFTTTRPVPAVTRAGGVLVQLVEIPGLLEGASDDRGGGRRLLGVLRDADAMILCHDITEPVAHLLALRGELRAAGIELPALVVATKADETSPDAIEALRRAVPDLPTIGASILDDTSLAGLRAAIWRLTGLVRVYLQHEGETTPEPVALPPPVTVLDVAHAIHHELGDHCRGARLWGGSARFDGQRVGRDHLLVDGDTVEVFC